MRRRLGWTVVGAVILCGGRPAMAQVAFLKPGDIALTCVDTSGTGAVNDHLQIMPLVPLPALIDQTFQLQYTDREADSSGVFDTNNESALAIPIPTPRAAGEPYDYLAVGIGNPDEQVFLFQGKLNANGVLTTGTLLWGFQISSVGDWATVRTDTMSELPMVLASVSVALTTNGNMKFAYTGPTTGTKAELQAAIAAAGNWTANANCPERLTIIEPSDGGVDGDGGGDVDFGTGGGDGGNDDGSIDGGGAGGAAGSAWGDGGVDGGSGAGGTTGYGGAVGTGGTGGDILAGAGGSSGAGDADAAIDTADGAAEVADQVASSPDGAIERINVFIGATGGSPGDDASDGAPDGSPDRARAIGGGCSCATRGGGAIHCLESVGLAALMMGLLACRRRRRRPC